MAADRDFHRYNQNKIAKNGLIFIKQMHHHLINIFLHFNRAKTAGIFSIYACFNQLLNMIDGRVTEF